MCGRLKLSVASPILVCMFEPVLRDEDGAVVDPRDTPAPDRMSAFCASQLDRFSSVLSANVEALEEDNQLELGAHLTSCVATLEWLKCRVASSLAIKDATDPVVAATETSGRGEPITRQLGGDGTPKVSEFLVTEVALAFGCSEREAITYLAVSLDLRFRLRCTNAEFGGGRISYSHARVISEETRHLDFAIVAALDETLADAGGSRAPARLRILARRKAAAADPAALARRHRQAMASRGAAMFSIGDGMGAFSLTGPLETMAVIDDQVNVWARRLLAGTPAVSFTAHRANAATRLLLGQHPLTGEHLLPEDLTASEPADTDREGIGPPASGAGAPQVTGSLPARTELRITMTADTLLGFDDATSELQGYGPITALQARQLVLQSACTTLRRVFTDPADNSVLFLDPHRYRFTRDQLETIRTLHPHSTFPGATTPAARCDIDHLDEYLTGSPAQTDHARSLQPARSPRAEASGLDPPGQTLVTNAQPLSRRHHRLKTHGGWKVRRAEDDSHLFHWTSPRGRIYTTSDADGA